MHEVGLTCLAWVSRVEGAKGILPSHTTCKYCHDELAILCKSHSKTMATGSTEFWQSHIATVVAIHAFEGDN